MKKAQYCSLDIISFKYIFHLYLPPVCSALVNCENQQVLSMMNLILHRSCRATFQCNTINNMTGDF